MESHIIDIMDIYKDAKLINDNHKFLLNILHNLFNEINNNICMTIITETIEHTDKSVLEKMITNKYNNFVYNFMNNINPKSTINIKINDTYLLHNLYKYFKFILIFSKLKKNTRINLNNKLFNNFNIYKIVKGNINYLNPTINKSYIDEIELKSNQKIEKTISRLYTCRKCKQNKTKYTRMQTRSSDEGYTMFINCIECGHKWMEHC